MNDPIHPSTGTGLSEGAVATGAGQPGRTDSRLLERIALRTCAWSERWIPDAYVFAAIGVVLVAVAALILGATPVATAKAFGDGFWSLIPFTMQMTFIVIGGFVVASSPPVGRLIDRMASIPRTGRAAVVWVTLISVLLSLIHWGLSTMVSCLLVRSLGMRRDLRMDYRAAAGGAAMGMGSVWAMGLSSSAAQLEANAASMPPAILPITGVIPFTETLFLWQSLLLTAVLVSVSVWVAWLTVPPESHTVTARDLGLAAEPPPVPPTAVSSASRSRPGEWLEYSPLLSVAIALLGAVWFVQEFAAKGAATALASLNTYNFLFLLLGLLLCWRPRVFLDTVAKGVPSVAGVLIQFPFYGGIASIITTAIGADGNSISQHLARFFAAASSHDTFPVLMGIYSAILGFFLPSGGGKWIVEAPYVMQAANTLHVHLGWAVQVYNAAEALPNLINPFWMIPILGTLRLKAREVVGFTIVQFVIHVPLVLLLLWALGMTLHYHPPVLP
jgi:short-chain fatty acids transporter